MENKEESQITDLVKEGLAHSIAQAFLIFSGALVIVSVWQYRYVSLSFFTLFYALINFKIEAIRKLPSLGNYGMRDNWGAVLYALASWLLLAWWIIGSAFLLKLVDKTFIDKILDFSLFFDWRFICSNLWIFSLMLWMGLIFNRKKEENNSAFFSEKGSSVQDSKDSDKYYYVKCCCENCDLDGELRIPKRIKVVDVICPKCKIAQQLKRKKDKEVKNSEIDSSEEVDVTVDIWKFKK